MADDRDALAALDARYRRYLLFLARAQIEPRLHDRIDVEGVVQQTLLEAWHSAPDRAGWSVWLRRLLAHNLGDALRQLRADKRDIGRERSLEADLAVSSARLADFLAANHSSPSAKLAREEQALQVAAALDRLPPAQREALILQHWHGWTLEQIGEHLQRSPAAVAGLLKRGLRQLREELSEAGDP
jgi:RNA polymerase sigma-70 factor (ECF subfamily)